jgi:hypothetical protein
MMPLRTKQLIHTWWQTLVFSIEEYINVSSAPSLPHVTSWTPSKSKYDLANSLDSFQKTWPIYTPDIAISKPHVHFPLFMSLQRIRPSPRPCTTFRNRLLFYGGELTAYAQTKSWRTTPCQLFAAYYSIYTQLPSTFGGFLHP